MLMANERLGVAVIPSDRMFDLDKAREALGGEQIRLAEEREFAPLFPDCEPGAEPLRSAPCMTFRPWSI